MRRYSFFSSTMDLWTGLSPHDNIGNDEEGGCNFRTDVKLTGKENVNYGTIGSTTQWSSN
jgi:hypothetical protein